MMVHLGLIPGTLLYPSMLLQGCHGLLPEPKRIQTLSGTRKTGRGASLVLRLRDQAKDLKTVSSSPTLGTRLTE